MAENEYLDSTKIRHWHSVALAICEEVGDEELAARIQKCLYHTLRKICKDLPLSSMIESLDDPRELNRVCAEVEGGDTVKGILIQAAHEEFGRENVVERFLKDALRNCLHDIPYIAGNMDSNLNMTQARHRLNDAQHQISPEVRRIAEKLAENPSWNPRQSGRQNKADWKRDHTSEMLNESLIGKFKK